MSEKKFTDEDIVKALECCDGTYSDYCRRKNCPYETEGFCTEELQDDTIALINRQKAEIERLTEDNRRMKKYYYTHDYHECHNEAIKEFAERLKETMTTQTTDNINEPCVNIIYYADETIDEIAKELTEGNHEQGKAD